MRARTTSPGARLGRARPWTVGTPIVVVAHAPGGAARTGLLHQEPPFTAGTTVGEERERAAAPPRAAAAAVDTSAAALAQDPEGAQSVAALERARRPDAWSVDAHVEATFTGHGLGGIARGRRTGELSGGQVARLSLVWLLLSRSDVLLLDELTNHLSLFLVTQLEDALPDYPGAVVIASHDRRLRAGWTGRRLDLGEESLRSGG